MAGSSIGASAVVLYGRSSFAHAQKAAQLATRFAAWIAGGGPSIFPGSTRLVAAYADLTGPSLPEVLDRSVGSQAGRPFQGITDRSSSAPEPVISTAERSP